MKWSILLEEMGIDGIVTFSTGISEMTNGQEEQFKLNSGDEIRKISRINWTQK